MKYEIDGQTGVASAVMWVFVTDTVMVERN